MNGSFLILHSPYQAYKSFIYFLSLFKEPAFGINLNWSFKTKWKGRVQLCSPLTSTMYTWKSELPWFLQECRIQTSLWFIKSVWIGTYLHLNSFCIPNDILNTIHCLTGKSLLNNAVVLYIAFQFMCLYYPFSHVRLIFQKV